MSDFGVSWGLLLLTVAGYPIYLLLTGTVLRIFGAAKHDVVQLLLRQAGRQRFTDVVKAVRGDQDTRPETSSPE